MWTYLIGWGIMLAVLVPVLGGGKAIRNADYRRIKERNGGAEPRPDAVIPYFVACLLVVIILIALAFLTMIAGSLGEWVTE